MRRLKSHTGCATCKSRKKKCDERRPVCLACARLNLRCSYDAQAAGIAARAHTFPLMLRSQQLSSTPPIAPRFALTGLTFESDVEEAIFARVPRTSVAFYSPASDAATRDEAELRLIMVEDELFRHTVIACFSVLLSYCGPTGSIHRSAFARALTMLRRRIESGSTDLKDVFGVQFAVNFIGLLESEGPEASVDLLQHFKAILIIMAQVGPDKFLRWPSLPIKLYTLLMESILFHASAIGIFSALLLPVGKLWQRIKGLEVMNTLNPPGPQQVATSPLLTGQYMAFDLILRLCCTHRICRGQEAPAHVIAFFARDLDRYEASLPPTLSDDALPHAGAGVPHMLQAVFTVVARVLRITLLTLGPSDVNQARIDALASATLALVLAVPASPAPQTGLIWAIQILACAQRSANEFAALDAHIQTLALSIDSGACSRIQELMARLRDIKSRCDGYRDEHGVHLDSKAYGICLLHRGGGILR